MYAAPIWFPNTSPSLIQKPQTIQNSVIHIATGCIRMTSIDQLHEENKMLSVRDHLSLISSQYLTKALQLNNPSRNAVTCLSGIRDKKTKTLQSRFLHRVASYLSSSILPHSDYGTTIMSLHTKVVSDSQFLLIHNHFL